ncbi:MAG: DUF2927 domain-containing protein [Rhodospirillaceae bacterium]
MAGLVAVLLASFFLAQPERRDAPSVEDVVRLFDRIAFASSENAKGQMPYVRRWTTAVRIAVIGSPAEVAESEPSWADGVRRMALLYDSLPNLDVSVVASTDFDLASPVMTAAGEAANMRIIIVPGDEVNTFIDQGGVPPVGAAALGSSRDGCVVLGADTPVLANVTLLMRGDLSPSRRNICLGEGMARAMGYVIDAKWASEVFRERQKTLAFHPLGRLAAALVYDPALTPGMEREAALAEARRLLADKGLDGAAKEGSNGGN